MWARPVTLGHPSGMHWGGGTQGSVYTLAPAPCPWGLWLVVWGETPLGLDCPYVNYSICIAGHFCRGGGGGGL